MAKITSTQLSAFARKCAEQNIPYWYGMCFMQCTESRLTQKKSQYPAHYAASRMKRYYSDVAAGKYAADCVGLIKGAIWTNCGQAGLAYAVDCPDISANSMIQRCVEQGAIGTIPEIPGLCVWMSEHIGVYLGNGLVAEARGFNYGCVITKLSERKWLKWGRVPYITYAQGTTTPDVSDVVQDTKDRPTLRKGSAGADVKTLQTLLIAKGYKLPKHGADGDFGTETEVVVKAFQTDNGLTADSIVGNKTWAALLSADTDAEPDSEQNTNEKQPTSTTVLIKAGKWHVRSAAGKQHTSIGYTSGGEMFPYVSTASNGWLCIQFGDVKGWVSPVCAEIKGEK